MDFLLLFDCICCWEGVGYHTHYEIDTIYYRNYNIVLGKRRGYAQILWFRCPHDIHVCNHPTSSSYPPRDIHGTN
jgi:hypothetical protein